MTYALVARLAPPPKWGRGRIKAILGPDGRKGRDDG